MKKLALILLLSLPVFAQKPQENLYSRAIQACLEKQDLRSVIIVSDFKLTNNLPTRFGEIKVEYLGSSELAQRFKTVNKAGNQKRGAIPVIEIYPLRDQGSKLSFAYNNYGLAIRKKAAFFHQRKSITISLWKAAARLKSGLIHRNKNLLSKK